MAETPLTLTTSTDIIFSRTPHVHIHQGYDLSAVALKNLANHPFFRFSVTLPCNAEPEARNALLHVNELRKLFQNVNFAPKEFVAAILKMDLFLTAENGFVSRTLLASWKHLKREMRMLWLKERPIQSSDRKDAISTLRGNTKRKDTAPKSLFFQERHEKVSIPCNICFEKDVQNSSMLTCKTCNMSVHPECYCIEHTWRKSQSWQCFVCQSAENREQIVCQACYEKGSAMMPLMATNSWVHASCAMYLPELYFAADKEIIRGSIPQVCGIELLRERRKLRCFLCKKPNGGACAQCDYKRCTTAYHVLCALLHGIRFQYDASKVSLAEYNESCISHFVQTRYVSACPQHQQKSMQSADKKGAVDDVIRKLCVSHEVFRICARLVNQLPQMPTNATLFSQDALCPSFAAFDSSGNAISDLRRASYVMLSIPSFPVGMEWITGSVTIDGHKISTLHLSTAKSSNSIVKKAVEKGVLLECDQLFAINDTLHLDMDVSKLQSRSSDPSNILPTRCWFMRLAFLENSGLQIEFDITTSTVNSPTTEECVVIAKPQKIKLPIFGLSLGTPEAPPSTRKRRLLPTYSDDDMRNSQWPWSCYLRSDGKLAMRMVWASIDSIYFRNDRGNFLKSGEKINRMLGLCLLPCDVLHVWREHFGHVLPVNTLLELPPVPPSVATASLIKVSSEPPTSPQGSNTKDQPLETSCMERLRDQDDDSFAEHSPIPVGVTVNVAKRTWPGINKLGGSGRIIKAHHERYNASKTASVYSYDIAYILGGREKRISRKYINIAGPQTTEAWDKERGPRHERACFSEEKPPRRENAISIRRSSRRRVFLSDSSDSEDALPVLRSKRFNSGNGIEKLGQATSDELPQRISNNNDVQVHFALQKKQNEHVKLSIPSCEPPITNSYVQEKSGFAFSLSKAEMTLMQETTEAHEKAMRYYHDESLYHHVTLVDPHDSTELNDPIDCDEITEQLQTKQAQLSHVLQQLQRTLQRLHTNLPQPDDFDNTEDLSYERYRDLLKSKKRSERHAINSPTGDRDEDEDMSFGGVFVNRVSHESSECCIICGLSGGDLAATSENDYVHPQCVIYTPETYFRDGKVYGIDQIPVKDRLALVCSICQGRRGLSKLQCAFPKCTLAFHIGCALIHGLLIREPLYIGWCRKHLETSGMMQEIERPKHIPTMRSSAESDMKETDGDTSTIRTCKKRDHAASNMHEEAVELVVPHKRQRRQLRMDEVYTLQDTDQNATGFCI